MNFPSSDPSMQTIVAAMNTLTPPCQLACSANQFRVEYVLGLINQKDFDFPSVSLTLLLSKSSSLPPLQSFLRCNCCTASNLPPKSCRGSSWLCWKCVEAPHSLCLHGASVISRRASTWEAFNWMNLSPESSTPLIICNKPKCVQRDMGSRNTQEPGGILPELQVLLLLLRMFIHLYKWVLRISRFFKKVI